MNGRGTSLGLASLVAIGLVASGVLLRGLFAWLALDIERHAWVMWLWVSASAVAIGAIAAVRARRVPTVELLSAALAVLGAAALLARLEQPDLDFASPEVRALLIALVVLGLAMYFGASAGYLASGGGRSDLAVGYESFIGRRFLLSKASPVLSTVTTLSVLGVALGVGLVIFALAVLSGFENDLQAKIIGANAHVVVQKQGGRPFTLSRESVPTLAGQPGVAAVAPFIEGEVALASRANYTGGLLFGIDPAHSPDVLSVLGQLVEGSLAPLAGESRPRPEPEEEGGFAAPAPIAGIVIGAEMKKSLSVSVGDRIRVISPILEEMSPLGMVPSSQAFEVVAVFSSKMYEFDARFAYVSLPAARRFFRMADGEVNGVQMKVEEPEYADDIGERAVAALGEPAFAALDWKQRNLTLFSALKLERVVAFVVLVFIILVASFSIVNTLTMSIIEKKKEIAILKTMGARDVGVMKIFLVQGMLVGIFGTGLGVSLALLLVSALKAFGFWIPGDVYYIDSLPVNLSAQDVILVALASLIIVWDFAVFPALRGSQLEPVEGLRDG